MNPLFVNSYVLMDRDGDLIGLDEASSGYPTKAFHPSGVKFWAHEEGARNYMSVMHSENFRLCRVTTFTVREVD